MLKKDKHNRCTQTISRSYNGSSLVRYDVENIIYSNGFMVSSEEINQLDPRGTRILTYEYEFDQLGNPTSIIKYWNGNPRDITIVKYEYYE